MFATAIHFHPHLIFVGNTGAFNSEALMAVVGTLAYYDTSTVTTVERLSQNPMDLYYFFVIVAILYYSKLECLPLSFTFTLI